jgi:hypothetical protein
MNSFVALPFIGVGILERAPIPMRAVWPHGVVLEAQTLAARSVDQGGMMSVMPSASLDLREFLRRHELDPDNAAQRTLFPGLDGLSCWL